MQLEPAANSVESARHQMIEQQLRTWEVLDTRVLDAVETVRRENFVPEAYRHVAFADAQIPIGHAQFMLQPKIDGKILQVLAIQQTDYVLDVGAGSGFLAACMGRLGARVRSVEIFADLAERARHNINAAAANNVVVDSVDATTLSDENCYDAIAITAAIPPHNDELNQRFKRALKVGGRMFMVTGSVPAMEAVKITRTTASHWSEEILFETVLEPLVNALKPSAFVF
jgi:protein-L-isoaspartate(D-aspartate) O-methyltransferase